MDYLLSTHHFFSSHFIGQRIYTLKFEDQIGVMVKKALNSMKPVNISTQNGISRLAVNRRNNIETKIDAQTDLKGPGDYAVPVIRVSDKKGKLLAAAFGYACHNTVLNGYEWSGDYAGYAQIELEKLHHGATALFFQGCRGNQNVLPRKSVPLARQRRIVKHGFQRNRLYKELGIGNDQKSMKKGNHLYVRTPTLFSSGNWEISRSWPWVVNLLWTMPLTLKRSSALNCL